MSRPAGTAPVSTARRLHHTYEQYLRALEMSELELEYCEGEIYAMAGGTPSHADLAATTRLLGNALLGICRVSSSNLRVRIELSHYQRIPSLEAVLLVSHRTPCVTLIAHDGDEWLETEFGPGARYEPHDPSSGSPSTSSTAESSSSRNDPRGELGPPFRHLTS